jgi:hypothetical protein
MSLATSFSNLPEAEQASIAGIYFFHRLDLLARVASMGIKEDSIHVELTELREHELAKYLPEVAQDGSGNNPREMFYQIIDEIFDLLNE